MKTPASQNGASQGATAASPEFEGPEASVPVRTFHAGKTGVVTDRALRAVSGIMRTKVKLKTPSIKSIAIHAAA